MRMVADLGKSKTRNVLSSSKRSTSEISASTVASWAIFRIAATTGAASARRVSRTLVASRTKNAAIAAKNAARSQGMTKERSIRLDASR